MMRPVRYLCAVASILLLTAAAASAQLATAELNGRITDSSGAVLPGATVTATQTGTGFERTVVTDETGSYLLSNLPVGPYRLEVSLQGFRSYAQTGLVLTVGATPTVNATLELGSLEETVTVDAAAPIVDVRSAGISNVVENEEILALPLNGRNPVDLVVMVGAAVQTAVVSSRGTPGGVNISVAGGLSTGVSYTLDGATHNNRQQNANLPLPFPDALQEFRVATSGLTAQNGVNSGASVNAVTKSGTNRFSGNVFEFLRHHRFNSTSRFAPLGADGDRVDDGLKRNQFGGTFGGPIIRDRLFFFGAYQGTAIRQRPSENVAFVPTPAMLAGDFTTFASPACNGGRQVNLTGGFVNNRIDPALFSAAGVNLAKRLPSTTDPCGQITFDVQSNKDEAQSIIRVDHQLTSDHSFFGRYMASHFTQEPGYAGGSDSILKTNVVGADDMVHSFTLGQTSVLSSSMVNALRFAVNKVKVDNYQNAFFSPRDIGANIYSYLPGYMSLTITGVFMGLGPCTINGVSYNVCSTNANLNQRRALFQQNPREAGLIGSLDQNTDVGYQNYRGLKLAVQRRSTNGLSINANYTLSRCMGTPTALTFNQASAGYQKPDDPSFDAGYCDQDRKHLSSVTLGYETPEVANAALRAVASNWRLSGNLTARSGNRLNIVSGRDNAFTGITNQRPNQVSDDLYGDRTLTSYFNLAAFEQPAAGELGNLIRNAVNGPAFWNINLALSKVVAGGGARRLELRLESFNLLNHFNWGDPLVNFNAGTFGRITTQAGEPRVLQFGIKYDF